MTAPLTKAEAEQYTALGWDLAGDLLALPTRSLLARNPQGFDRELLELLDDTRQKIGAIADRRAAAGGA